jgi:protease-4
MDQHFLPRPLLRGLLTAVLLSLLGGCAPSFLITPVANTSSLEEHVVKPGQGWFPKKVAIIEVEGMLANTKTGGLFQATENSVSLFVQELHKAEQDPDVRAVVLRVNSPGGTVTAADTMYEEIQRFKQRCHKPVVASTQELAASGAYYVSCAADRIVAHPTSIVGSIGVIFEAFNFQGTLNKLGIVSDPIKSGPLKDMASPFRDRTAEETAVMQQMVDEYFHRFVGVVEANRHIQDAATLKLVTDGRVFTGRRAVELGLADRTGLLEDAIQLAATLAHVPGAQAIIYKRPYGYTGSIYADAQVPRPQSSVLQLNVPALQETLPAGFYYLWRP